MKRGATARLFVAADLPEGVRATLAAWARAALGGRDAVRRVEAAMLHVTLAFLGSCPVDELEAVAAVVHDCGTVAASEPPWTLALGAPAWLPPRRPRVLAIGVHDGSGGLAALRDDVVTALARTIGFEPERRRFRPHVTVARIGAHGGAGPRELPAAPAAEFEPAALTLYRSTLRPSGAAYEPLERVELAAGGGC